MSVRCWFVIKVLDLHGKLLPNVWEDRMFVSKVNLIFKDICQFDSHGEIDDWTIAGDVEDGLRILAKTFPNYIFKIYSEDDCEREKCIEYYYGNWYQNANCHLVWDEPKWITKKE